MPRKSYPKGFADLMPPPPRDRVQAEGKALSSKNASKIKAATEALESAIAVLRELVDAQNDEMEAESAPVTASAFTDIVDRTSWATRLDNLLWIFTYHFHETVCEMAEGEIPETSVDQLLGEFVAYLKELAATYPQKEEEMAQMAIAAQAAKEDSEALVELQCSGLDFLAAASGNRCPIEGKLFVVDEPSEGIPAKGPGRRLLIPAAVAQAAIGQVGGLPLDASPTLDQHDNDNVVGVMLSATVRNDNGFWVRANLFPFNQPEMVQKIQAQRHNLGFSINAYAPGHIEVLASGEEVWVVDQLTLLGANVLYKTSATFQQTELVAATQKPRSPTPLRSPIPAVADSRDRPLIAASADIPTPGSPLPSKPEVPLTPDPDPMEKEQFENLIASSQQQSEDIKAIAEAVSALAASVQVLSDEREARIQAERAQQAEREAAAQQEQIAQLVQKTADSIVAKTAHEAVTQALRSVINPSGQPSRITSPIAASAAPDSGEMSPNQQRIMQLEAALVELSRGRGGQHLARRLEIKDELRTLRKAESVRV